MGSRRAASIRKTPDYFPRWIQRATIQKKKGGSQDQVLCENTATLVYLADQACITPHVWLSRADDLHRPDRLIFDLDPPTERFDPVRRAARWLRDLLRELNLSSFVTLTGSRGAHVVVPLRRVADFDEVREFARGTVKLLADRHPDELTIEQRKKNRGDRLFLDVARNAYAQTAVCPYSVRARAGAPVATPIDWDELDASDLQSNRYTVKNLFRRLAQRDDPWTHIARHAVGLRKARERLDELASA